MRRLPPLNGLRAFEAAARHGRFAAAGAELHVTQAAVSRIVRLLEDRLGFQLFERLPNGLVLTAQGKALQPGITAAFDAIAGVTEQVSAMHDAPILTVGVGPSFAVRWLIPRLAKFHQQHADIEILFATGGALNPFKDDWTCGILLGDGDWANCEAELLFSADLFPVCAPAVAQQLKQPADLRGTTLLHVQHSPDEWPQWLKAAGETEVPATQGPSFDTYAMALQAAVDGVGIAMGLRPYVEDDLADGRLVAPFSLTIPKRKGWYLVYRTFRRDDSRLNAFRLWLHESFKVKPHRKMNRNLKRLKRR